MIAAVKKIAVTRNPKHRTELIEATIEYGLRALSDENEFDHFDRAELHRLLKKTVIIQGWKTQEFLRELTFEQMILLLAFATQKILP